jgi:hypothetical protein
LAAWRKHMAVLGVGLFEVRSWLESIRYVTVKGLPTVDCPV